MIPFTILFKYVLLFIALMIPGYLVGKWRKPNPAGSQMTGFILTDIAMPFLVLSSFLKADLSSFDVFEAVCAFVLPFAVVGILYLLTLTVFKSGSDPKRALADRYCAIIPNCGFLGMPLAMAVFGADSKIVVLISVYNVANTFIILTAGEYILAGKPHFSLKKLLLSPVNFAIVFGVLLSVFKVPARVPILISYADYLAQLTTPLSMTVLGYVLSKLSFGKIIKNASVYLVSAIKLVISPVVAMGLLLLIESVFYVDISLSLASAVFISSGVSTAATATAIAEQHGADGEQAALTTLGSTILCIITLPLLYILCCHIFA